MVQIEISCLSLLVPHMTSEVYNTYLAVLGVSENTFGSAHDDNPPFLIFHRYCCLTLETGKCVKKII